MNPQPNDQQKAEAFDSYITKILKYAVRDYFRQMKRRGEREVSLSGLTGAGLSELGIVDKYFSDEYAFDVLDWRIAVSDYELGEALNALPADKRGIVLLSYFLDMTDEEIARRLKLARSTVTYRRASTLRELKKMLEENADESYRETT